MMIIGDYGKNYLLWIIGGKIETSLTWKWLECKPLDIIYPEVTFVGNRNDIVVSKRKLGLKEGSVLSFYY